MSAANKPTGLESLEVRMSQLEAWRDDAEPRLRIVEKHVPSPEKQAETEKRITSLEHFRVQILAVAGVMAFVGSALGPVLKFWITGH